MTRAANDYSGAVISTVLGLLGRGIAALGWYWVLFMLFVVLMTKPWLYLILLPLAVPVVYTLIRDERRTARVRKAHEDAHRAKYGREPRPWKNYPIHK